MSKNSFKLLQEEDEQEFARQASEVQQKIEGTLDVYRHIGQLVDVYISKAVSFFGVVFGEESPSTTDDPPEQQEKRRTNGVALATERWCPVEIATEIADTKQKEKTAA